MKSQTPYSLFSNADILRLIIPLLIEQLLFSLVGTADTFMVASLGEASISAVSLVDMLNNCIANIFFALATGGAVVASQAIGAKHILRARESAKQLLMVVFVVGMVVMLACETFLGGIIHLLYGDLAPDVHAATMTYSRITLLSLPSIAVYSGCSALFRSMNRAKTTMVISFASNLINIIGNAILIFGCRMGVAGAAWATLFSRVVAMGIIAYMITDQTQQIFVNIKKGYRFSGKQVKNILGIGIPGGIENGVFQFGRVIVLGLIASYGTREIAANAVANTIDYFGCIPGSAFSLAVVTVIGQAVGVGDSNQVKFYVWKMMKWAYSAHIIWNVLLFCATPALLNCFSEIDVETRKLALVLIIIHNGIGLVGWPLSFVFPNILRSVNDVRWPMFISIGSMVLVRVGISYAIAGPLHSGVVAVWIAMICDWIVRIAGFLLRYRSGIWITLSHCKPKTAKS